MHPTHSVHIRRAHCWACTFGRAAAGPSVLYGVVGLNVAWRLLLALIVLVPGNMTLTIAGITAGSIGIGLYLVFNIRRLSGELRGAEAQRA